jgi:hypothetical protein
LASSQQNQTKNKFKSKPIIIYRRGLIDIAPTHTAGLFYLDAFNFV